VRIIGVDDFTAEFAENAEGKTREEINYGVKKKETKGSLLCGLCGSAVKESLVESCF